MKKLVKFICILMAIMTLSACKGGLYMEDFKDVQWTCSDINMQFVYADDEVYSAVGIIEKDGENVEIVCDYFATKVIWIYDKSEYDALAEGETCDPLLTGSYTIKGDVATVKITTDNLFNGEYLDKEIELTKTPLK